MTSQSHHHNWDKLSPREFQHLQELASYSTRKLQDVLQEFCAPQSSPKFNPDGDIDYTEFRRFLDAFLDCETPEDLVRHLFVSFLKPNVTQSQLHGKALNQMAAISSTAACAPVTAHTKGSIPNINSISEIPQTLPPTESRCTFVEKIHGITDKLHSLGGHLTHDSSKTGSIHPVVTVTPSPLAALGNSSIFQNANITRQSVDSSPSHSQTNHSQMSRNSSKKSNNSVNCRIDADVKLLTGRLLYFDPLTLKVPLKDVVCYLSLLEAGRPEDKLEFMFRLYDTDGNGVLDTAEMDAIVNQMMAVAEYLGWDVSELRPILQEMMIEIDYDADGTVSLEEWQRGGLTTIPLLVLLGVDSTTLKEDGIHVWRLKNFSKPAYCNLCLNMLVGLGKKGLCCVLCKYTVHERCVQHAPASCITTYVKSKKSKGGGDLLHHWVEGNCYGRCSKCRKRIKAYHGITGLTCRWCHMMLHNRCASSVKKECLLGEYAELIVPPTAICPAVLDRQRSVNQATKATHFQITPSEASCPLLVFVNPKSGGRQGDRILRKFQYMLNPRQVYDLSKGGLKEGLTLFKDLPEFKVICCGGDGTVGWVLEAMDSIELVSQPAIGVIPLGTGNDLARCLRWGGGYEGENIPKLMDKIKRSSVVMLDRWSIEVRNNTPKEEISRPQASLHSNMHKVIELSQSVIVNKTMMEEILRNNAIGTSSTTTTSTGLLTAAAQSSTITKTNIKSNSNNNIRSSISRLSISSSSITTTTTAATETPINEDQHLTIAPPDEQQHQRQQSCSSGVAPTRITTKSISMSTFETHQEMTAKLMSAIEEKATTITAATSAAAATPPPSPTTKVTSTDVSVAEHARNGDSNDTNATTEMQQKQQQNDQREPQQQQVEADKRDEKEEQEQKPTVEEELKSEQVQKYGESSLKKPLLANNNNNNNEGHYNNRNDCSSYHNNINENAKQKTYKNSMISTPTTIAMTNEKDMHDANATKDTLPPPIEIDVMTTTRTTTETSTAVHDDETADAEKQNQQQYKHQHQQHHYPTEDDQMSTTDTLNGIAIAAAAVTPLETICTVHVAEEDQTAGVGNASQEITGINSQNKNLNQLSIDAKQQQQQQQQQQQPQTNLKPLKLPEGKVCTVPYNIINNYFSVGVDAAICVKFHLERERNPHKFNSRMKNKLWYFEYATSETFAASCKNLHEYIEIVCDGVSLDLANGPHLQGVALLNIPYTHGGSNLWGEHLSHKRMRKIAGPFSKGKRLKSSDKELSTTSFNSVDLSVAIQDIGDHLIEVIGLENCLHMGQVRTGLRASGRRLAQCSEVTIKTKKTFPMQIDGEPWMQVPCTITVTHKNQVPMLMAPRPEKGKGLFHLLCS